MLRPAWPEYLMEAAGLGLFMLSACVFATLLENPASLLRVAAADALAEPFVRRCWMSAAMGATALAIFYSPWARRSGAHINPAVTLTFWRLGRIGTRDAIAYAFFQTIGGTLGVYLAAAIVGNGIAASTVRYAVTVPGDGGTGAAFAGEIAICLAMMSAVLWTSSRPHLSHFGGLACATLLALFIVFESPLSGTSLNPARTIASAIPAGVWTGAWIYLVAPPVGMLAAAELHLLLVARSHHGQRAPSGVALARSHSE
jgi:aquaporin Z